MKRNSLTTALLAGLAGAAGIAATANAVNVNPDGIGGALIYPYYTVNKGNTTLISVVNTTSQVKAVKVRFLEGRNSREVLDFNLYLSPFDVWVGAVVPANAADANSGGVLISPDRSCTVPAIPSGGFPFVEFAYTGAVIDHNATQLPRYSTRERTREGYFEMIEMGVVNAGTPQANAATHNLAGFPANCAALVAAWLPGGSWASTNGAANISLPSGGLYGSASIVNVAEGVMYSYDAVALEGFYTNTTAPAALHTDPSRVDPQLGAADNGGGTAQSVVFGTAPTFLPIIDNWGPVNAPAGANGGWDAVSAVLMHDNIYNEYLTDASLGATSEWVVTFPTKRAYVDPLFLGSTTPRRPFSNIFSANQTRPGACERYSIGLWDREERTPQGISTIIPSPPPPVDPLIPVLCYEAQVVTFNQTLTEVSAGFRSQTANLGSRYAENIPANSGPGGIPAGTPFTAGHARLTFNFTTLPAGQQRMTNPGSGNQYNGLPVVGFWTQRVINASAGGAGVLANYSGTWEHKYSRNIVRGQIP
jgi:hypothetical protein